MIATEASPTRSGDVYPFFHPHSPYAHSIFTLSVWVLVVMLLILLIVVGLVVYCSFKFRGRRGDPPPKPIYGNVKLELTYTIGFVVILGVISVFSIGAMIASDPPAAGGQQHNLVVVGHQWWWEVRYPEEGVITANEIHVPVNKPEYLTLLSADVIHDFWVPELGRKMDMIPGTRNHTWFAADKPGTYFGRCAEYCGAEHAWMRIRVIAQTPADYAAWLKDQQTTPPPPPAGGLAAMGAADFQQMSCSSCHAIRGTPAHARIGPDLTHVASRETLAAGRLENTPANLSEWLKEPDIIKPRCLMPNLHLSREQNQALVAYLETLK